MSENDMGGGRRGDGLRRRTVLQGLAGVGSTTAVGSTLVSGVAGSSDSQLLGGFESDFDKWRTSGGNTLSRVSKSDFSDAVTEGDHALKLGSERDPMPSVRNTTRPRRADFTEDRYLVADVTPLDYNSDVRVSTFKFSLRYDRSGGRGRGRGGGRGQPVQESSTGLFLRYTPSSLICDLSTFDDSVRENVKRVDIHCYPGRTAPDGNAQGKGQGQPFDGEVIIDNVRLTSDTAAVDRARYAQTIRELELEYGLLDGAETTALSDGVEEGVFIFDSGYELPYTLRALDEGAFEYVIDGDSYRISGEQA